MRGCFNEDTYAGIKRKIVDMIGEPTYTTGTNYIDGWEVDNNTKITLSAPMTARETRSKILLFKDVRKVLVASFQNGLPENIIERGVSKVLARAFA